MDCVCRATGLILVSAVAGMTIVAASYGMAGRAVIGSEALSSGAAAVESPATAPDDGPAERPDDGVDDRADDGVDEAVVRAASATAARAAEAAEHVRVIQGRAAVDPRSSGTVVAHAVAAEIVAFEAPTADAPVVATFQNPTERGGPLVFSGVGTPEDGWLQVLLPIRPNGTTGWIRVADVELSVNPYRIEVDASAYRLTVYRYGREQLSTTVAIGNGATPTPIGDFFLIELLRPTNPGGVYGPYAYGLSGYSETLDQFNGGAGIIGIHGTNQPELLGQEVSHGCIRVANPTIAEMTEFLPLGTPVSIFRAEVKDDGNRPEGRPGLRI